MRYARSLWAERLARVCPQLPPDRREVDHRSLAHARHRGRVLSGWYLDETVQGLYARAEFVAQHALRDLPEWQTHPNKYNRWEVASVSKEARNEAQKRYWKRHPEKRMEWARKNPERVRQIQRRFNGQPEPSRPKPELCELCGQPPRTGRWKTLHLDHCHMTGVFRGWICNSCNTGLGCFRDNVILLRKAAEYLEALT